MSNNYAWLSYQDVISQAAELLRDYAMHEFQQGVLAQWASNANVDFARRSETVRIRELRVLAKDQQMYRLPADAHQVVRVVYDYPGNAEPYEAIPIIEDKIIDGVSVNTAGWPSHFYINELRDQLGVWKVPTQGGVEGTTTSGGSTTTLISTDASAISSTDDEFNSLKVRVLEGDYAGEERTISDYDGATGTITVSSAFSGVIATGLKFEIHPDSLKIDYIGQGNIYAQLPTEYAVQANPDTDSLVLTMPQREPNFYKGMELYFTSGDLEHCRTRIITSTPVAGTPTDTTLTVFPELPTTPTAADTLNLTEVPNIPPAFHHYLVDGVVARALEARGHPQMDMHRNRFEQGILEGVRHFEPKHKVEFQQIQLHGKGEYEDFDMDFHL